STFVVRGKITPDGLNDIFLRSSRNELNGTMKVVDHINGSTEMIGERVTCVIDASRTKVVPQSDGTSMVSTTMWYDNEMGYVDQFVELAAEAGTKIQKAEEKSNFVTFNDDRKIEPAGILKTFPVTAPYTTGDVAGTGSYEIETIGAFTDDTSVASGVIEIITLNGNALDVASILPIIGKREYDVLITEGAVTLEVNGEPLKNTAGDTLLFTAGDSVLFVEDCIVVSDAEINITQPVKDGENEISYVFKKHGHDPVTFHVNYMKNAEEEITYSAYDALSAHTGDVGVNVDLFLPKEMFSENGPGSRESVEALYNSIFGKRGQINIRTYDSSIIGLYEVERFNVREGAVAVLGVPENVRELKGQATADLKNFLRDKRILALPAMREGQRGVDIVREITGAAIMQASLKAEDIQTKTSLAKDVLKMMRQFTGNNRLNFNDLYGMLAFNDDKIPAEIKTSDAFEWMIMVLKSLLINMEMTPFDPLKEMEKRRQIMWAA
ncbi:MAG: hypothetical protein ABIG55_02290, partial [Candidatus Omnitrophota bacterium]